MSGNNTISFAWIRIPELFHTTTNYCCFWTKSCLTKQEYIFVSSIDLNDQPFDFDTYVSISIIFVPHILIQQQKEEKNINQNEKESKKRWKLFLFISPTNRPVEVFSECFIYVLLPKCKKKVSYYREAARECVVRNIVYIQRGE